MKFLTLFTLLFGQAAFAVTTTATVYEVANFPVTVTYSSGNEKVSFESSYQRVFTNKTKETVVADIQGLGDATLSDSDTERLKATYCSNTFEASELNTPLRPTQVELAKIKVLKANKTQGKTTVIRLTLDYHIPYMGNAVRTFIVCNE